MLNTHPKRPLALLPESESALDQLEASANAFLKAAGIMRTEKLWGPDNWVRGHKEVRPDPITRFVPAMTKQDRILAKRARLRRWNARTDAERKAVRAHKVAAKPYSVRHGHEPLISEAWQFHAPIILTLSEYRTDVTGLDYAWIGHRRIEVGTRDKSIAKVKRTSARKATTGARGKAVTYWSMSTRSLPAHWRKASAEVIARATLIEQVVLTSERDHPIALTSAHVVIFDGTALVRKDDPSSRAMSVREYARRAALSGLVID